MKLLKKIKKYTYETNIITYHNTVPVKLYKCNLIEYLKNETDDQYFINGLCPIFCHRSRNIFSTIKEYSIIVGIDNLYNKLSEKSKKILIYHELGHIINDWCDEDEADKYAVEKVGKISMLDAKNMAIYISSYHKYKNPLFSYPNILINIAQRFVY